MVTAVVRKQEKLPKPQVNAWGDLENFKFIKQRVKYPVSFTSRAIETILRLTLAISPALIFSDFFAKPFRSRLAYLYSEGTAWPASMTRWESALRSPTPMSKSRFLKALMKTNRGSTHWPRCWRSFSENLHLPHPQNFSVFQPFASTRTYSHQLSRTSPPR